MKSHMTTANDKMFNVIYGATAWQKMVHAELLFPSVISHARAVVMRQLLVYDMSVF